MGKHEYPIDVHGISDSGRTLQSKNNNKTNSNELLFIFLIICFTSRIPFLCWPNINEFIREGKTFQPHKTDS